MKLRKIRFKTIALLLLYIVYVFVLFWFHPFVASAAETDTANKNVPGGYGNTVRIYNVHGFVHTGNWAKEDRTIKMKKDIEMIGFVDTSIDSDGVVYMKQIRFNFCKNGVSGFVNLPISDLMDDYVGVHMEYSKETLKSSWAYKDANICNPAYYYYGGGETRTVETCTVTGMKIFADLESAKAYANNGSLDGMLRDLDDGELDKEIGYVHDLKHLPLMYGEKDENGLYSSYDDRFTWSDYYPEYDDSYLVEVRASCEVEVKKWFGIGKSTIYNSNIRELARDVRYKDLEYIVSLADERAVFSDFLNEYMPGNSSVSDVISAATYQFDAYYFRIYRWDEESQTYKHGLWVRLTKDGTALDGDLDHTVDAGDLDDDDNWHPDPDTDYGDGKPGSGTPGSGDSQDDAKDDADRNQDEKENGDHQIDLSNTNFKELWEWFTGLLITFWEGLGVIPDFFGRIFSFLPTPVIGGIGLAIVAAIILRIIGR